MFISFYKILVPTQNKLIITIKETLSTSKKKPGCQLDQVVLTENQLQSFSLKPHLVLTCYSTELAHWT